jgi:predicted nucleic acid-binding Zn ribbon protein
MAYNREEWLKRWRKKMGLPPPNKHCVVCGDAFQPVGGATTCSSECSAIRKKETADRLQRERNERRRQETAERQAKAPDKHCVVCGDPFRPDGTNRITCSDVCQHEHHAALHREAKRERRAADPEAAREEARRYREANREAVRAYGREWSRTRRAKRRETDRPQAE